MPQDTSKSDTMSPIRITFEMLKLKGIDNKITFEQYISLRTDPKTKEIRHSIQPRLVKTSIKAIEQRGFVINSTYALCSVGICGKLNIRTRSNQTHCPAPGCEDDPHHVKKYRSMHWCPVCRTHFYGNRCILECQYCTNQEHGPLCIFIKGSITCRAPGCKSDPHHRSPDKSNHSECKHCNQCHDNLLVFCEKCNKCFDQNNQPHCPDSRCQSTPHQERQHCTDPKCQDPHHVDAAKQSHRVCPKCNQCHIICIDTEIEATDLKKHFPVVGIVSDYALANNGDEIKYCSKCNICNVNKHCDYVKCQADSHHQCDDKKGHRICTLCNQCHDPRNKYCKDCNRCYNSRAHDHCFTRGCATDPHHISNHRCNVSCYSEIYSPGKEYKDIPTYLHDLTCPAMQSKHCDLCNKCHIPVLNENNLYYCDQCNMCYDKEFVTTVHCPAPECMVSDPHHIYPAYMNNWKRYGSSDTNCWCSVCKKHWAQFTAHKQTRGDGGDIISCNHDDIIEFLSQ